MKPLTQRQKTFCRHIVDGQTATDAYLNAFPSCRSRNSAASGGSQLMNRVDIRNHIDQLSGQVSDGLVSRQIAEKREILEFLTAVMRGGGTQPPDDQPLAEKTARSPAHKQNLISHKLKAAQTIAKLKGYDKPELKNTNPDESLHRLIAEIRARNAQK